MLRFLPTVLLSAALTAPITMLPLRADDRSKSYHDRDHNDEHHWDSREDRAYKMWVKEQHRKRADFHRLKEDDQRAYWNWRHDHSDAVLKINIR